MVFTLPVDVRLETIESFRRDALDPVTALPSKPAPLLFVFFVPDPSGDTLDVVDVFFRRKRRNPQVRATAAFALAQIPHPRIAEILSPFVEDQDLRVKEIARNRVYSSTSPSSKE